MPRNASDFKIKSSGFSPCLLSPSGPRLLHPARKGSLLCLCAGRLRAAPTNSLATFLVLLFFIGTAMALPSLDESMPQSGTAQISGSEWAAIRSAHETAEHMVEKDADGQHFARNPGQQWQTQFDGRGFLTTPENGDWKWGLELREYGLAGAPGTKVNSAVVSKTQTAWSTTGTSV